MMRKALQRNRLIAVILTAAIVLMLLGAGVAKAASIDFAGDDFMILDAKTGDQIGNVHYAVSSPATGHQEVTSFARYNDGTYDVERDDFDTTKGGDLPVMFDYEHTFYKSNGTVFLLIKADFRDGDAVCASYADGEPHALKETLNFPSSTYVGAAMMLPMRQALRQSISNPIELYDFVCIPGPKLIKVEIQPEPPGTWNHYPGDLVRTNIKPDFGIFSFAVDLFVPDMYAWFNPSNGYNFVGGKFARYYKGPEIILARKAITAPTTVTGIH
ncbi:MAG TPA: hypothetical protein VMT61_10865 [Candidatus Binataceae bacterium]|nr:hypothetical protein [Candidatus Binataceae bacterium]